MNGWCRDDGAETLPSALGCKLLAATPGVHECDSAMGDGDAISGQ